MTVNASGARAADLFNAATIGGATALGRSDLGRLAPGAKADVVIIDLRTTRYGPVRDPINALVEYGSGADVETVIVDGEIVVEKGRSTRINDEELFAQAEAGAKRAWDNWPVVTGTEEPSNRSIHRRFRLGKAEFASIAQYQRQDTIILRQRNCNMKILAHSLLDPP